MYGDIQDRPIVACLASWLLWGGLVGDTYGSTRGYTGAHIRGYTDIYAQIRGYMGIYGLKCIYRDIRGYTGLSQIYGDTGINGIAPPSRHGATWRLSRHGFTPGCPVVPLPPWDTQGDQLGSHGCTGLFTGVQVDIFGYIRMTRLQYGEETANGRVAHTQQKDNTNDDAPKQMIQIMTHVAWHH